jgi:hypothetical protein
MLLAAKILKYNTECKMSDDGKMTTGCDSIGSFGIHVGGFHEADPEQ